MDPLHAERYVGDANTDVTMTSVIGIQQVRCGVCAMMRALLRAAPSTSAPLPFVTASVR